VWRSDTVVNKISVPNTQALNHIPDRYIIVQEIRLWTQDFLYLTSYIQKSFAKI